MKASSGVMLFALPCPGCDAIPSIDLGTAWTVSCRCYGDAPEQPLGVGRTWTRAIRNWNTTVLDWLSWEGVA